MAKNAQQKQAYECEICGATSDTVQTCCGQTMKKSKKGSLQNRTENFYGEGSAGNKKKSKGTEVSRFINEGNPND